MFYASMRSTLVSQLAVSCWRKKRRKRRCVAICMDNSFSRPRPRLGIYAMTTLKFYPYPRWAMAAAAIRLDGPINEPQGAMYRTQMQVIKTWLYTHTHTQTKHIYKYKHRNITATKTTRKSPSRFIVHCVHRWSLQLDDQKLHAIPSLWDAI